MRVILIRTLYKLRIFIRFIFFIISIIFVTQSVVLMSGKGVMELFLSVPYQKNTNNEGFSFSIENATEYELAVDVMAYGQKEIAIKVFRGGLGKEILFLDKSISTYSKNKNRISFPINLKEGNYYFSLPDDKLKKIRLYPRKPTTLISSLFYDLERNMLVWIILPITGFISFIYFFYFVFYFLPRLMR